MLVITTEARAFVMFSLLVTLGYLMVSHWRFPAFDALRMRVSSFQIVFPTAMATVFLFYGVLFHFATALLIVSWAYVLVSFGLSFLRYIMGPKAENLAGFEPEPEVDEFENEEH